MQEDLVYKLALKEAEGIGGVLFRHLISHFGTARAVISASESKLQKVNGIGKGAIAGIKGASQLLERAQKILERNEAASYHLISFQDAAYPKRFKGLYDAPPLLFVHGQADLNYQKTVAIVGTRKATEYGKELTEKIVQSLQAESACIVSGLAYGIDIAAHKAAIKYNLPTIAVMAGGLDQVYPAAHRKYVQEIASNGALLSENLNDVVPVGPQFIARNRIIAALSDAVIVVESAKRGGGLVTAEYGNNYNREVYAVPGDVGNPYSEGTNNLIRRNKAKIYTSVKDLIEDLNWDIVKPQASVIPEVDMDLSNLSADESLIISLLRKKGEYQIDDLSFDTNIPLNKLASLLLNLEFQDYVKALPGKKFKLK